MFHNIPSPIADRMRRLEELDIADRIDGSSRKLRLRQVPPETGQFLALLAASAPTGNWIEIGTSAGYSTLWLSLAARAVGSRIVTYEIDPRKVEMAVETFRVAGVDDIVELVVADAREHLDKCHDVAFCFLDAEKEIYQQCYDVVVPRLVNGGLLVADNAISHRSTLQPMLDRALDDDRVDSLVVPISRGELVCRKIGRHTITSSETHWLAELSAAVRDSSLKRLRTVPEGRENWRPTAEAMSFADLAQHLVDADNWLLKMLVAKNLKPIVGRAGLIEIKTREEYLNLLEELAQSGVRREQTIRAMTDKDLAEMIYDERFGREVSAWWIVVRGNFDHEAHHRGQVAAYLRMLGAVASGDSA